MFGDGVEEEESSSDSATAAAVAVSWRETVARGGWAGLARLGFGPAGR